MQELNAKAPGAGRSGGAATPPDRWFYLRDGSQCGPVSPARLSELISRPLAEPPPQLVWTQGMDDWRPYPEVFDPEDHALWRMNAGEAENPVKRPLAEEDPELAAEVSALGAEEARIVAMAAERADAAAKNLLATETRAKSRAAAKSRMQVAKRERFLAAVEAKVAEQVEPDVAEPARKSGGLFVRRQWYFTSEGERRGPVAFQELRAMATASALDPRLDLIWKRGDAEWRPAGEIDGLFARSHVSADQPAAERPTKSQQLRKPATVSRVGGRFWPGARRRSFVFFACVFPFAWHLALAAAAPVFAARFGTRMEGAIYPAAALLPIPAFAHFGMKRLLNLGMSRLWLAGFLAPVLNLWVIWRCAACPAGYAFDKRLDRTGFVITALLCAAVVMALLYPAQTLGPVFDDFGRLWRMVRLAVG